MSHGPISNVTVTAVKYRVGITGGSWSRLWTVGITWDFRNEHEEARPDRAALLHATRLLGSHTVKTRDARRMFYQVMSPRDPTA